MKIAFLVTLSSTFEFWKTVVFSVPSFLHTLSTYQSLVGCRIHFGKLTTHYKAFQSCWTSGEDWPIFSFYSTSLDKSDVKSSHCGASNLNWGEHFPFSFWFQTTVHVKEYKSSRYPKPKRNKNHIHKLLLGEPFYMKSSRLQQQTNE